MSTPPHKADEFVCVYVCVCIVVLTAEGTKPFFSEQHLLLFTGISVYIGMNLMHRTVFT